MKEALLYLCQFNPWPLSGGGLIRDYWLIQTLARRFSVDLVTADAAEPAPAEFAAVCREIRSFPRPTPGGKAGRALRAAMALRPRASLLTAGIVSRALQARVGELVARNRYRLVLFDLHMYEALPSEPLPFVYNSHNCESALFSRSAQVERLPMRLLFGLDALRLRRIESDAVRRAGLLVCCSQADIGDFEALSRGAGKKAIVVPNGVDVARYEAVRSHAPTPGCILITGSYSWRPNQLGLDWFIREVLPRLEERAGGAPFEVRVAGRMTREYASQIAERRRIVAVPNPADMREELARATVIAAPILASSGTRLRILEAWAAGRPVVSTQAGAFGLDFEPGVEIAVHDEAEAFAVALRQLLDDAPARASMSARGIARANDYDWHGIGDRLLDAFAEAFPPPGA